MTPLWPCLRKTVRSIRLSSAKLPRRTFSPNSEKLSRNILTVHDVLFGENGDSVAAQFEYDWTLASGDKILFQGVDYFRFGPSGKFASMSIFYDTYPTREGVGDQIRVTPRCARRSRKDPKQGRHFTGLKKTSDKEARAICNRGSVRWGGDRHCIFFMTSEARRE